jgi:hypothetical protein
MTPATWREVEIEKARCEGYICGFGDGRASSLAAEPELTAICDRLAKTGVTATRLYALRPCGCQSRKMNSDFECDICHGSGIAPEGVSELRHIERKPSGRQFLMWITGMDYPLCTLSPELQRTCSEYRATLSGCCGWRGGRQDWCSFSE